MTKPIADFLARYWGALLTVMTLTGTTAITVWYVFWAAAENTALGEGAYVIWTPLVIGAAFMGSGLASALFLAILWFAVRPYD